MYKNNLRKIDMTDMNQQKLLNISEHQSNKTDAGCETRSAYSFGSHM